MRPVDLLLLQAGAYDAEVRTISLKTLNDDDALSMAALFWTGLGWIMAYIASGWTWLFTLILADLLLWGMRFRLQRGVRPFGRPLEADTEILSAWLNLAWVALIAIETFVLTQAPGEQTTYLGVILSTGFCGYASAQFAAFPALAVVNIVLLNLGLGIGLLTGNSDAAQPLAPLVIAIAIAFVLLTRRIHVTLLGSIRAQLVHRRLALHDPLTKLPNRAMMRETLSRHLAAFGTADGHTSVAVLCLDLDGFKEVNDRHGHAAGDWVLIHVAEILRTAVRHGDMISRIGGDEYVAVLPDADPTHLKTIGEMIVERVATPLDIGGTAQVRVGVSIGAAVAFARLPAVPMDDLLERADAALYEAKRSGRGRIVVPA